jgi:hypothetical protein
MGPAIVFYIIIDQSGGKRFSEVIHIVEEGSDELD